MTHLHNTHETRRRPANTPTRPRRSRTLLYARDPSPRAWDGRARGGECAIGVACRRCWRPLQAPGFWFKNFCQCGEEWDILETTLAAHGLTTTTLTFHSNPTVYCG